MDFHFKQFSIAQDRCAMKIGTDGVLLGSWATLESHPNSILDIGTGTGLISLMLAQRSSAELIDAMEIDDDAFEQAVENFEESPWSDRLFCYHASLEEFVEEMQEEEYDLIVCNPPFFKTPLPSASPPKEEKKNKSRQLARFYDSLPFEDLLKGVSVLLSGQGNFSVVLPIDQESTFSELAAEFQLFPNKITKVKGNKDAPIKRVLLNFTRNPSEVKRNILILEESRHQYTPQYLDMVRDFYLKL